jgi:hypothetical protein
MYVRIAPSGDDRHLDVLGYALIATAGASLGLCRRRPEASVGIVTVVLGIFLLRHYVGGPVTPEITTTRAFATVSVYAMVVARIAAVVFVRRDVTA